MTLRSSHKSEIEVRADAVKVGDYLLGLGRVQSVTTAKRITLHGEFGLWRAQVDAGHRVVVLRVMSEQSSDD